MFTCKAWLLLSTALLVVAGTPRGNAHAPDQPLGGLVVLGDRWVATNFGLLERSDQDRWLWTPEELLGPRINVWSVSTGHGHIAVGTDDGVWLTDNGGCTWRRLGDAQLKGVGVRDLLWRDGTLSIGAESADGQRGGVYRWDGATLTPPSATSGSPAPQIERIAVTVAGSTIALGRSPDVRMWRDDEAIIPAWAGPSFRWLRALGRQSSAGVEDGLVAAWASAEAEGLARVGDGAVVVGPVLGGEFDLESVESAAWAAGSWWVRLDDGRIFARSDAGNQQWQAKAVGTTSLRVGVAAGITLAYWGSTTAGGSQPAAIITARGDRLAPFEAIEPRDCRAVDGAGDAVAVIDLLWPTINAMGAGEATSDEVVAASDALGCSGSPTPSWWLIPLVLCPWGAALLHRRRPPS